MIANEYVADLLIFTKPITITANGSALLRYAMIFSVEKLTQAIKSNIAGFLRIQRHNRKMIKKILKRPLK